MTTRGSQLLDRALGELQFFRRHPAASLWTLPRFAAWQARCLVGRPATVDFKAYGVKFYCPAERRGTAKLAYTFREQYEPELAILARFVGPGDNVIDVGAHFGAYTVALAALVGETGSVLAVEAASHAVSVLEKNIRLNALVNVAVARTAAGDRAGTVWFGLADDPARSSLVNMGGQGERVPIARLDDLVKQYPVRFVKIDVEGAEPLALAGGRETLQADKPIIQFEYTPDAHDAYGYEPGALVDLLVIQLGYELFELEDGSLRRASTLADVVVNLYAIHPEGVQPRR